MVDNRLNMPNQPIRPLNQGVSPPTTGTRTPKAGGPTFGEVLRGQLQAQPVKFSAHAARRLLDRNITLSDSDLGKLNDAVDRAAAKGARESLVLVGNVALVVSVKNRTVITAVDGESMKENVFTNIDSAVIT